MEPVKVNFQLKGIELLELNLKNPQTQLNPERTYDFNISIEQGINNLEKRVVVITSIDLIFKENLQNHASIKTSCIFAIENLQDFIVENSNEVKFPQQFVTTLNSIALSTTRGIMFSHFKGTFLNNVILPIIDPSAFTVINADQIG